MDIKNKKVLIFGGWGLVGSAIARKIVLEEPEKVILTSLRENEAKEICEELTKEFKKDKDFFVPYWGNIFVREEYKDLSRDVCLVDDSKRRNLINDIVNDLEDDVLTESTIYKIIEKFKPQIIIDCINTATTIAYQNIYKSYNDILNIIDSGKKDYDTLKLGVEKLLSISYIPQLIRHIQILGNSMTKFKTEIYLKIGTSGTGGMGLNIPYTHSEERPSRVLLSKASVAGAQTLLLFLMARTPDGPIVKEIKPTASIAWKQILFGDIKKGGKPVELLNIDYEKAEILNGKFERYKEVNTEVIGTLKTAYIDTGENGIFSRGEYEAITTVGQMEFVTPEEIAEDSIREIKGGNTGHDIISALDGSVLEPTYRAGIMQKKAVSKLIELEKLNNTDSVAFEMLGPPRLSKLLYEAHLIRLIYKNYKSYISDNTNCIVSKIEDLIKKNSKLRSEIVSIGIPILLSDGKKLLRGNELKVPAVHEGDVFNLDDEKIEKWANEGWVDLRSKNWETWKLRFNDIIKQSESLNDKNYSSRYFFNKDYWDNFEDINIGKIVGWIFIYEENGLRMKS
jgi:hypothetical protein